MIWINLNSINQYPKISRFLILELLKSEEIKNQEINLTCKKVVINNKQHWMIKLNKTKSHKKNKT